MPQTKYQEFPPAPAERALSDLMSKVTSSELTMLDQLRLVPVPLAPEISLYLAEDAIVLWARLEAELSSAVATPFWASAWAGGQGLARYLLDNRGIARGKRVLDLGSGSGLAAIAAALCGAESVTANDIDLYSMAAISMNAAVNRVVVTPYLGDILDQDGGDADLVLAGDALYAAPMAASMLSFLRRVRARGGEVLIGDPGRGHLPEGLELLTTYQLAAIGAFSDAEIDKVHVLRLT